MEMQDVIIERNLRKSASNNLSRWIQRVDHYIFKIVVDYIVRNFDPTGINIWGLTDSFYQILIKPQFSSIEKVFRHIAYCWRFLNLNLFKSLLKAKLVAR